MVVSKSGNKEGKGFGQSHPIATALRLARSAFPFALKVKIVKIFFVQDGEGFLEYRRNETPLFAVPFFLG